MKMITGIKLSLLVGMVYAQSIEETLEQISALKTEISQSEKLVEKKIADLKRTNPLFAEQDAFESDAEYLGRMSRAMPQLDRLRKQYLDDLWKKMSILRGRMFETSDITVVLDKNLYDANNEKWPFVIQHNGYQKERFERSMSITKNNARELYKNWDKVQKTGVLTVDAGDKIGLAKFKLFDPISGIEFNHEFRPMRSFNVYESSNDARQTAFSPNGKLLAVGSNYRSSSYKRYMFTHIYNLETGKEFRIDESYSGNFSPDGKFLSTSSGVYDLEQGGHVNSIPIGIFSPDGKFLATSSGIYNLETSTKMSSLVGSAFSPNGKLLASTSGKVYNLETGATAHEFNGGNSVAFSPDGEYLAIGGKRQRGPYSKITREYIYYQPIIIWSLKTGQLIRSMGGSQSVNDIAYSPDGKYLAASWGAINIYKLSMGNVVRSYEKGDNVVFSPDGKYIAATSSREALLYRTLFQVEEEVLAQKAISYPPSLSASISFSEPSGNQFLDAMETGAIKLTMTNKGDGSGKGLLAKITPERIADLNYNNTYIEEIPSGESISVEIPLEAYIGIADGNHTFRIDFEEINGFPPDPVELQFSTRAYLKSELYLMHLNLAEGDVDGNIEVGEMINITLHISNKGEGIAKNAYAKFYAGDNVFISDKYPKTVSLGNLTTDSVIEIPLEFFINNKTLDAIPLYMDLTEETNLANLSKLRLPISLKEGIRKIDVTIIKKDGSEIKGVIMKKDSNFILIQDQDRNTVKIPVDEIEFMSSGTQKNK